MTGKAGNQSTDLNIGKQNETTETLQCLFVTQETNLFHSALQHSPYGVRMLHSSICCQSETPPQHTFPQLKGLRLKNLVAFQKPTSCQARLLHTEIGWTCVSKTAKSL